MCRNTEPPFREDVKVSLSYGDKEFFAQCICYGCCERLQTAVFEESRKIQYEASKLYMDCPTCNGMGRVRRPSE